MKLFNRAPTAPPLTNEEKSKINESGYIPSSLREAYLEDKRKEQNTLTPQLVSRRQELLSQAANSAGIVTPEASEQVMQKMDITKQIALTTGQMPAINPVEEHK